MTRQRREREERRGKKRERNQEDTGKKERKKDWASTDYYIFTLNSLTLYFGEKYFVALAVTGCCCRCRSSLAGERETQVSAIIYFNVKQTQH